MTDWLTVALLWLGLSLVAGPLIGQWLAEAARRRLDDSEERR